MVRTQRAVLSLPEGVKRRKISRSEEGSSAKPVAFPLGMDSACASNTPSDESQSSGQRDGRMADFGALGAFLRRDEGASRFSAMLRDVKSGQITALTELSEYLSFSSEEALISFPTENFIQVLIGLLEDPGHDETAAQAIMLCCRCLFHIVDILPPATRIIAAAGGLPALCENLLNVAYIDVAELAVAIVERISEDQPLQVLKVGGLQAILTFLDFFQIAVQRQAVKAASLMLFPTPSLDDFDQHIRPLLPTLANHLQHSDPQVLQSVCECWRRALDSAIIIYGRPRGSSPLSGPSSSRGRMVGKGKWRGTSGEPSKKDRLEPDPTMPLAAILEELCPCSVISSLIVLLGAGISTPHTSVVTAEVLYILAVLVNYSDSFAKDVLDQDICTILSQMLLTMGLASGDHSSQSFGLLRVLVCVASLLPTLQITDGLVCEERRLALFQEHPKQLDVLAGAFFPILVDVYESSMDPNMQSMSLTLLLTLVLMSKERPEIIQRFLDPTRLASFLANLLHAGASNSAMLACLLIVSELLERHSSPYALLLARHGVVLGIQRIVDRAEKRKEKAGWALVPRKATSRSKNQLLDETAQRLLSTHFDPHACESDVWKALGKMSKQLQSSSDHRDALCQLHDLLLGHGGVTAFEFSCSGAAQSLKSFLNPQLEDVSSSGCGATVQSERLGLFVECMGKSSRGAFAKLIQVSVSAVQRVEQQPLTLFPAPASLVAALPPHLQLDGQKAPTDASLGKKPGDASLSVLRLLAKPLRVRVAPSDPRARPKAPPRLEVPASPAVRLRNYLASKVGRKRAVPSPGGRGMSISGMLSGRVTGAPGEQAVADKGKVEEPWTSWDVDDDVASEFTGSPTGSLLGSGARGSADDNTRERELLAESVEAVLVVEPLATISALEDYIWEKHGRIPYSLHDESIRGSSSMHLLGKALAESGVASAVAVADKEGENPRLRLLKKQPAPTPAPDPRRMRLFMKQPPCAEKTSAQGTSDVATRTASRSPTRSPTSTIAEMEQDSQGDVDTPRDSSRPAKAKKRVQLFYNGQPLQSKSSIVQSLVAHTPPRRHDASHARCSNRFLVSTDDSSSDAEVECVSKGPVSNFCSTVWGHVHSMTYEFVDEPASQSTTPTADEPMLVVKTDFDCLIQRHGRIAGSLSVLHAQPTVVGQPSSADTPKAVDEECPETPQMEVTQAPDVKAADEELLTLFHLLSAFHNISEHLRSQGDCVAKPEDFQCTSLTSKLVRQLSDPLAVCTGSIPAWCSQLVAACPFLFPYGARRVLHQSCNLGLSRALHHVQQRTLATQSQEAQRRLEGEIAVANLPRQKVRISRQQLLESAVKVMNVYGSSNTILEVEYIGEVGTGSGPTLEFFAQVAEILKNCDPPLFRRGVPFGLLFPAPQAAGGEAVHERFRLLGQVVAKCILDSRLVDLPLHPLFWQAVLGNGPFSQRSLCDIDPVLYNSMNTFRSMDGETLKRACVDFTLPGYPQIELKPGGAQIPVTHIDVDEYVGLVAEASVMSAVSSQVAAFRTAFAEILPLQTCRIWSAQELAWIIVGSPVDDDTFWNLDHLSAHIKAAHGYQADSRCFRDLLCAMTEFTTENRRSFLTFCTGAPTLPVGGFAGLKPQLSVVKKESPPAPLTPDHFMPSVMTCANYLKLPEYTSGQVLRQKLQFAMTEGQAAFLLS